MTIGAGEGLGSSRGGWQESGGRDVERHEHARRENRPPERADAAPAPGLRLPAAQEHQDLRGLL